MKRILLWSLTGILLIILGSFSFMIWSSTDQLLFPVWRDNEDFSACSPETSKHWGNGCGNLRLSKEFKFEEIKISSSNGFELPTWKISSTENGYGPTKSAIFLVHGGGSDRREMTKHIRFFLKRKIDVFSFDYGCHGESACSIPGLTYGYRESKDVLSVYKYLSERYDKVFALGSSVGASSIIISLPQMQKLSAVIAENPMYNFERLILEFPGTADKVPAWLSHLMIHIAYYRGKFDGSLSPASSLPLINSIPIFFIHSKEDQVVSYTQTKDLADLYQGPKTIWFLEKGEHGSARDIDPAEYERRLTSFLNSVK
ncbi:alpha/beta hydrolase [Leptospira sarikeiensis]|uniref:Alpha/beta hydrolase n=1 Tax=Leptospira sarikeiensis TaxID=2484943 RepID=A0A4V3JRN6_9LEPT|nr:alpha/beta hydrolase [Leptospira sarikeiensis]TGL60932.1 alpha/beta hydrolase [Leptospira sarikeiensis]